jgi:hypothetical protein
MTDEIPYGYCHCGCGGLTTIPKNDHSVHGYTKGVPIPFIMGHNSKGKLNPRWNGGRRMRSDGYAYLWIPDHPRSCKNYVMEHIVIAEKAFGKPIPLTAEIHHVNENRADNTNSNLVICQDLPYHRLLHRRLRAFKNSGHADWRKCTFCKQYDDVKNLTINTGGSVFHHLCELKKQRERSLAKRLLK